MNTGFETHIDKQSGFANSDWREQELTWVWESYENNGDRTLVCLTEDLALNHKEFEVQHATRCRVYLFPEAIIRLRSGKTVWDY